MVASRDKVLQWLSHPRKQSSMAGSGRIGGTEFAKWLLIFDNADSLGLIRDYWPLTGHGSVLVTPRDPLAKTDLATQGTDLPPMSNSECAELLRRQVGESSGPDTNDAAMSLAIKIGSVPLAICQIATQIRRNHMTIEEYVNLHGDESLVKELSKIESLLPQEQYRFTLATVWCFENFSPQALGLLHVMVFMDSDAISERILEQNATENVQEVGQPISYAYPQPGGEYAAVRNELSRTSLVVRNNENKTLSWHRQVQEVAREKDEH